MSEKRTILLPLIGSIFGLATGFIATYNILGSLFGSQEAPTSQLLIESGLWICWVGLQGIGFILIYMQNRQGIYAGTGVVGLLAMVLEIIAIYQIWNAIEDVAFALIGISSTVLYLVMAGYSITLLRVKDSLGQASGYLFIITGIVLIVFPPVGFPLLGLSNLLTSVFFLTLGQVPRTTESASGLSIE